MQPRIVGIISSPSRNGNTAVLVREALRAAAEHGAEVEEISLPAHKLHYCTACFHCMSEGAVLSRTISKRSAVRCMPSTGSSSAPPPTAGSPTPS